MAWRCGLLRSIQPEHPTHWLIYAQAANSYWPAFRKSFGASGKTSLIIMPPIVAYNLAGEASVLRSLRRDADGEAVAAPSKRTGMTWHLRAANLFCEHTLLSFAVVITPM